jgi:hypothetical protein
MKRLDWTLIRPARPDKKKAGRQQPRLQNLRDLIDELESAIETRVHEATRRLLSEEEVDQLADLEERLEDLTIASCEAARAPRVEDDPDWENRLVDEYADADTDLELDEFLEMRKRDFDCERCPHAAVYSLYPQDPCEMSVGPLLHVLGSEALVAALRRPMGPEDMRALADELERVLDTGSFKTLAEVDAADLLQKSIDYLRFWARLGFGIRPELVDEEDALQTPEGLVGPPAGGSSTLLH